MFYDCSQPIANDAPQWVDYEPVSVTTPYQIAKDGFNAERVDLTTHTGTHVDAPFHFFEDGSTVDALSVEQFFGRAIALDLRDKRGKVPIERGDVERYGERIEPDDIVLIATGMGSRRAKTREWLMEYPYLAGDAAAYLAERKVRGVGTDAVSIGGFGDPAIAAPPHRTLLRAGIFVIEDMLIPDALLDGRKRRFRAFPIRVRGAGAAWARPVAWDAEP